MRTGTAGRGREKAIIGGGLIKYQIRTVAIVALLGAALSGLAAVSGSESPDLVEGLMCVRPIADGDRAGDCGPVQIAMLSGNRAVVRISDIVYRLQLHANQVDIVLMHGSMQIDGFTAPYDWQGKTLNFKDTEKGLRYKIDFDPKAARAKK